jgi:putative peptidoglycan lipid II flippase
VYVRLLEEKREEDARRVAGAVASFLFLIVSVIVLGGVLLAPVLVDVFAAGYAGPKRELCVRLVRIMFPGTGILVLSAWCLGVLNSHRRFFLSYVAPVLWNAAIVGALIFQGRSTRDQSSLAVAAAVGAVIGSSLQFLFQLPVVLKLLGGLRLGLMRDPAAATAALQVRAVGSSFLPVVLGRGVIQVSSWVDAFIASFLFTGAMAGLGYAQMLYQLPISIFGMAVSASELPEMARVSGDQEAIARELRPRLTAGLRRMAFFVLPSAVAFIALGDTVVALVYRTGRFGAADAQFVWAILAGFAVGLLAATQGRLYSSAFYALRDTTTPFRIAVVRVALGTALGVGLAFALPPLLGLDRRYGVVGLALASGIAAWIEMLLLRRRLAPRIGGKLPLPWSFLLTIGGGAAVAAAAGWGARIGVTAVASAFHPGLQAAMVLAAFGVVYLAVTWLLGLGEARALTGRVLRRLRR